MQTRTGPRALCKVTVSQSSGCDPSSRPVLRPRLPRPLLLSSLQLQLPPPPFTSLFPSLSFLSLGELREVADRKGGGFTEKVEDP